MKNYFFCSLRNSLITLVLLAVLPALGIILHSSLESRSLAIREAEAETLRTVQLLAREQQLITMRAEQLLSLLAQMPQVRTLDGPATTSLLRRLKARGSVFDNIVAADAHGRVFAAAQPYRKMPVLKGGRYFEQALTTGSFAVGQHALGQQNGAKAPLIHFAAPIPGTDGQPIGVLVVTLRPDRYERFFDVASLPKGSVLTIADTQGTRIYRYPPEEGTSPVGKPLSADLWETMQGPDTTGTATVNQDDGVRRIVGFAQLWLEQAREPYLYISVGIPERQALAKASSALRWDLTLLVTAAALAILVAWGVGGIVIGRPVERLTRVARRMAGGELSARSAPHEDFGELSILAKTLDDLAEALSNDIDAREVVETELRKSEALLRMILDALPVGVWMVDPQGETRYANGVSRRLLGSAADIGSRPCEALSAWVPGTSENLPKDEFVLAKALAGDSMPQPQVLEVEDRNSPGRLIVRCAAIPIHHEEGRLRAVIMVMEDITERTQREQARESIEHMMRHDLRSPLAGFVSLSQLLLCQSNLTAEQREWAAKLGASASAMLRAIDAYLKLSQIERGTLALELASVDMLELTRGTLKGLDHLPQFRSRHVVVTMEGEPPPEGAALPLHCEQSLCATMLSNLLKNALEASPEGGIVEVDLKDLGTTVQITVSNAGEVPQAIRQRFFEKYVTAGKKHGTGLGTYSARCIAEFHGGSIQLDSATPGRTRVTVLLPRRLPGAAAPSPEPEGRPA
ncbi:MAG: PAS domain-containing protein [Desulfovibrio sp.]|jgi:PAS domain S-box-containing protein|nr:PAS domain-containing protein [Desulfovibrio sp.]